MYNPVLCVTDPELLKIITVKDFEYFCGRDVEALGENVDPLWSRNLLCLRGHLLMIFIVSKTFINNY